MCIKMNNICILIPIYKEKPSDLEYKAIENAKQKFRNYDMKYFGPGGMCLDYYPKIKNEFVNFDKSYFSGTTGYSKLLLSDKFYRYFTEYQYIMILQPDVWILRDDFDISYFQDWDYVGAPWTNGLEAYRFSFKGVSALLKICRWICNPQMCYVGNGGFSLRNVNACRKLIARNWLYARLWRTGEDVFFAYFGLRTPKYFKLATVEIAEQFSLEKNAKEKIKKGHIPVGVHAWEKWYPELLDEFL